MLNNIFDTHAHYADSAFDSDRDSLLSSFQGKGIKYIMLASTSVEDTVENAAISEKYDYVYTSAGVHPENLENNPENYLEILKSSVKKYNKIKAIGEIGLDYHYEGYDKIKQAEIFEAQVILANELDLPVIVHSRDACEDTLNILKKHKPKGIMHCFSGSAETAKELVKLGMYIGFTGVITFKNASKALKAIEVIPKENLLIETDCPYLAPVPFRGKRCDSSMLMYTAEKMAEIKGLDVQELVDITCENAKKIYSIRG